MTKERNVKTEKFFRTITGRRKTTPNFKIDKDEKEREEEE